MVDQLIDVIEPVHVGATGDITPEARAALEEMRELNGKTSAFQDTAIAGRIKDTTSLTFQALDKWRPAVNVLDYGADNTGMSDCSPLLNQLCADPDVSGLYFPAGNYRLDNMLDCHGTHITAERGARIFAGSSMSLMVRAGGSKGSGLYPRWRLSGGIWDGNGLASDVISAGFGDVSNVEVRGGLGAQLSCGHACRVHGAYLVGEAKAGTTGLRTDFDGQYSDITVWCCETGVDTHGYNQFTDLYVWGGHWQDNMETVGIRCADDTIFAFNGMYLDTLVHGFHGTGTGRPTINGSNLFAYNNGSDINNKNVNMFLFDLPFASRVNIDGLRIDGTRTLAYSKRNIRSLVRVTSMNNDIVDGIKYLISSDNRAMNEFTPIATLSIPDGRALRLFATDSSAISTFDIMNQYGDVAWTECGVNNSFEHASYSRYTSRAPLYWHDDGNGVASVWLLNSTGKTLNGSIYLRIHNGQRPDPHLYVSSLSPTLGDLPAGSVKFNVAHPIETKDTTMTTSIGGGLSLPALTRHAATIDWTVAA